MKPSPPAGIEPIAPGFALDLMARHPLDFWLTSEDLPDPANRVTLDRQGNLVLACTPNNETAHARLRQKLESLPRRQHRCEIHGAHSSGGERCHAGTGLARRIGRTPAAGRPLFVSPAVIRLGAAPAALVRDPTATPSDCWSVKS